MNDSRKYGRSFHYPFSEGTTSDDRINYDYWNDIMKIPTIIHTEKLDGEGNAFTKYGVFARSHAAPTISPWTAKLREKWNIIKHDIGDYEIFGENLYAIHSIGYNSLPSDYFVFGVRYLDMWLSWEETEFISSFFDFKTVPILYTQNNITTPKEYESNIKELVNHSSVFDSYDVVTELPCNMEGLVSRNYAEYTVDEFTHNLFKIVRKNHVKPGNTQHWTKTWKKAKIYY